VLGQQFFKASDRDLEHLFLLMHARSSEREPRGIGRRLGGQLNGPVLFSRCRDTERNIFESVGATVTQEPRAIIRLRLDRQEAPLRADVMPREQTKKTDMSAHIHIRVSRAKQPAETFCRQRLGIAVPQEIGLRPLERVRLEPQTMNQSRALRGEKRRPIPANQSIFSAEFW
jgi:hypothetical protein